MQPLIRQAPRRHSKLRLFVFKAAEVAMRRLGGRRIYRWLNLAPGRFDLRQEQVDLPAHASSLDGLLIVQLSDIHAGPFLAAGDLRHVVEAVNALEPDLVVFTGDLISRVADEAWLVLPDLAKIQARHGFFAVFGNHDYRHRREAEIASAFGAQGIRFLRNESVRPLGPDSPLVVLGVEDLEEAKHLDVTGARKQLREGDFEVVLSHNPGGAQALLSAATGLVLSGHTHGRQVDLPVLRGLGPHHPGDRIEVDGVPAITTHGLGVIGIPFRYGAPAEVVVIRLVAGERTP
ncbi:MAG: putative MPP superfamily phosphohydrolase [Bacteroidia bacterium]|jgi:predicted MPP superfamily phosphohydrolase